MIFKIVLYLQYLGLLEPSCWEGGCLLLVISPCSVATLKERENLTGHGNSRGVPASGEPHCSASGQAGLVVVMVLQCRRGRRTSGHHKWFSQWSHKNSRHPGHLLLCLVPCQMLCPNKEETLFFFFFHLRQNTEGTFFQYKTNSFDNHNTPHPKFLSSTPCSLGPNGLLAVSTQFEKIPIIGNIWNFCTPWEQGPETMFLCFQSLIWLVLCEHFHRWNRCLAKTPVCSLSQWG